MKGSTLPKFRYQRLKELGLVIEIGERESIRGKTKSKVFGLSLYGLWVALSSKDVESRFEEIINIYTKASSKKYPEVELDAFVQLYCFIRDMASACPGYPIRNWALPTAEEVWSRGFSGSMGYVTNKYMRYRGV